MKTKVCLTLLSFIIYTAFVTSDAFAQTLPTFIYVGGGHGGNSLGDKVPSSPNNDPNLTRLVVKKYNPARFELLPASTKQVTLGGSTGCTSGTGTCFIDEVWKTNATIAPTLYTKGPDPAALVNVGWVNKLDASGNQCVFDYVLIDDDGTTNDREGFYITTATWTRPTVPSNLTYCTQGYTPPTSTNPLIPVNCSAGPTSTMVSIGSFPVPRSGNLYIVSRESIGYASAVTCRPVPPPPEDKTDFTGFLWGIDDSAGATTCRIGATAAERSNCRLDQSDLNQDVLLRFYSGPTPSTQVGSTYYNHDGTPPSYSINDLLLDNNQVRICINPANMVHPIHGTNGTYTLASVKIGNTSYGVSGNCSGWFTPPNTNGNNNVHLGFTYTPPVSFDPPWYSTNNGDIFAGGVVVDRNLPSPEIAPSFTNNIVTSGIGSVLGHAGVTPTTRYAQTGAKITNMVSGQTWGLEFPNFASPLPTGWETSMPGGSTFNDKVYAVSYTAFNNWLNRPTTSYAVNGNGLAVVYVHGNPASNTLNFTRNLTALGTSRLLIITDVPVTFTANTNFGTSTIGTSVPASFQAAVVSTAGVTFATQGSQTDKSLLYHGLVATSGVDPSSNLPESVTFGWDRGAENEYPATHVNFDPAYAWMLAELDINAESVSNLTTFDLTWEVLD